MRDIVTQMYHKEPCLVPPATMVRYLAVFHRAFETIDAYWKARDRAGMLLSGHLANALHNVPEMLWHSNADSWFTPENMEETLVGFPISIRRKGAPARLVADSKRIISPDGTAATLGLHGDLSDFDLAPLPELNEYLENLHVTCLSMRFMRRHSPPSSQTWDDLDLSWTKQAEEQAAFNGRTAATLLPLPSALVSWSLFDESAFQQRLSGDSAGNQIADELSDLASKRDNANPSRLDA